MTAGSPTNEEIAEVLDRVAGLLEAQDANPYRVRAYRRAVRIIEDSKGSIGELALSQRGLLFKRASVSCRFGKEGAYAIFN
jgi:DNA polymerase/3'-5' exonuclease PolX